ncbi:MAG: calcium-translocating P-type ATPase, PMCA-type [Clostridia bacterium]|nr:calcium-translocating P-type ATPase, PMCA-type [Clostridia bacterium]
MQAEFDQNGLSARQAEESRKKHGSNVISKQKRQGFLSKLCMAFSDPIIKILCATLAVNILFAFRGQGWFETVGIALSIFLSSLVSTLSEYGSESAFIKLQEESSRITARIRRDGQVLETSADEIVVDDVVLLQAGDMIPADGIIVSGNLSVDQSSINGESREQKKHPDSDTDARETLAKNTLFRGTVVTSGEGVMLVRSVGDATVFGALAASLSEVPRESPLKARLSTLAKTLSRIGYVAAFLIAAADLVTRIVFENGMDKALMQAELMNIPLMVENLLHALTLAISIIIMAVPEGLPMMITVVLSRNMFKMLKDKVMVRKLAGIETAGCMNILFTDKTGTLTLGKPKVERLIWYDGEGSADSLPDKLGEVVYISGLVNTSSKTSKGRAVGGNATDRVLAELALSMKSKPSLPQRFDFVPFDSDKKYSVARCADRVYIKGAPEKLIEKCTHYRDSSGIARPLKSNARLLSRIDAEGEQGNRLLCICTAAEFSGEPKGLCFEVLAVIGDPVRREARPSVEKLQGAGVQVVMVTGDSKATASSIARQCGILTKSDQLVLTGQQLSRLTDKRIAAILPNLAVVARALPGDKSRLVRISQSAGMVCGMTGDGINDAPALRLSDVGFAMGSGTEVAREAGDIVITDDNISSICRAVLYGRTILRSIQRFIVFQLTVNFCAVGISLIGPFIGIETPVTVAQILWINMIMDTLGGLAFAGEPPLEEYMTHRPVKRSSPLLNRNMKMQIGGITVYTLALYLFFLISKQNAAFFPTEGQLLTGFFALFIFCGIAAAFCARTERANVFFALGRNCSFMQIMSAVAAVQLVLIYLGGEMFRAFGLSPVQLGIVLLMAVSLVPVESARKLLLNRSRHDTIESN